MACTETHYSGCKDCYERRRQAYEQEQAIVERVTFDYYNRMISFGARMYQQGRADASH